MMEIASYLNLVSSSVSNGIEVNSYDGLTLIYLILILQLLAV